MLQGPNDLFLRGSTVRWAIHERQSRRMPMNLMCCYTYLPARSRNVLIGSSNESSAADSSQVAYWGRSTRCALILPKSPKLGEHQLFA